VILDRNGNVLDAKQRIHSLTGHRELDEIRGRSVTHWTAPDDEEENAQAVKRCFGKGLREEPGD